MDMLRYSAAGVARSLWSLGFGLLVMAMLCATGGANHWLLFRLAGPVWGAALLAAGLWCVGVQAVLTALLLRGDRIALAIRPDGVLIHTVWARRVVPWRALTAISLDAVTERAGTHYDVRLRTSRWYGTSVRANLLVGTLDAVGEWVDRAEAQRLSHGGAPVRERTGLLGWLTRRDRERVTSARRASRA